MNITLADIIEAIANGVADDREDGNAIVSALNRRSRYLAGERGAAQTAGLKVGDKAVIGRITPKALTGAPVTINKILAKSMKVTIDPEWIAQRPDMAKYGGYPIGVPRQCIEQVQS